MGVMIGTSSKMNLTSTGAAVYLDALGPRVDDLNDRELFAILPFTSIWMARDRLTGSNVRCGSTGRPPGGRWAHT